MQFYDHCPIKLFHSVASYSSVNNLQATIDVEFRHEVPVYFSLVRMNRTSVSC